MKKSNLPFLFLILISPFALFSCASVPEENAEESPEEIVQEETPAEIAEEELPEIEEPVVYEEQPVEEESPAPAEETVTELTEETPEALEKVDDNEILPPEEEIEAEGTDEAVTDLPSEESAEDTETADDFLSEEPQDETIDTLHEATAPVSENQENTEITSETAADESVTLPEVKPAAETVKPAEETASVAVSPILETENTAAEDENADSLQETEETTVADNKLVVPSRKASMMNSQYIDVVYPGSGWIYLGETDNKNLMRYFGRKLGDTDTTFTFRSTGEGSTILHFYKNDPLTDSFIDDYLAVEINGKNTGSKRVTAPSYADVVPERFSSFSNAASPEVQTAELPSENTEEASEKKPEETKSSNAKGTAVRQSSEDKDDSSVSTVVQNTKTTETSSAADKKSSSGNTSRESTVIQEVQDDEVEDKPLLTQDQYLQLAQDCYSSGNYSKALKYLDLFFETAVTRIDEGLYLKGQILESNSSVRNIKSALETYETLVKSFPQSKYWKNASERIVYINRFYFNKR